MEKIGISTAEAEKRLLAEGKNTLGEKKKSNPLVIFAGQFKDVMVIILLIATAISSLMGEFADAITIIVIVILNAALGFIQEFRTEKTLEALKKIASPTAKVYRDGKLVEVAAETLVRGDILALEAGDKIPADCKIISAYSLECDESILTGESVSAAKKVGAINGNEINQSGVIYMGTSVTKGRCTAEIINTGRTTQMGMVSNMLNEIEEEQTPLQKRLGELGKIIGIACLVICFVVSLAGILHGFGVLDMLLTGISLAVAAIPEGLPATVTISLALAVRRIYKQKALVNKLHSVETLGCTSVICTDKTGTLTLNKMTVKSVYCCGKTQSPEAFAAHKNEAAKQLFYCGAICNSAENGKGDPTEIALINSAYAAKNMPPETVKIAEIPFESATRYMSVTVRLGGSKVEYLKGSSDVVMTMCGEILTEEGRKDFSAAEKRKVNEVVETLSSQALRSLAFAYKPENSAHYIFLGIQAMSDPLRPEIRSAVRKCERAGIRIIMLTGDHVNTAAEIAKQAGILKKGRTCYTSSELRKMSDEELQKAVKTAAVFARVSPADKLRIVRAVKSDGSIVAMTGDGVNDAPAVKEASIGVAMGITGTDVTKEAAQIVLLDDNFATLVSAVEQGRTIYSNIRKFIRYMLSCNIGEVLTMLFAMLMGMPVVLVPIQLLLINLVTDGLPAIALGMEPPSDEIMSVPPRKPDESVFAGGMLFKIILRGIFIGISTLAAFVLAYKNGTIVDGRTAALAVLGLSQLIFVFECKDNSRGIFNAHYLSNPKLILAAFLSLLVMSAAVFSGVISPIFQTSALSTQNLIYVLILSFAVPVLSGIFHLFGGEKK